MGKPLHILTGIAPGTAPYTEVELGLGMEIGTDLGIAVVLDLTPGTEEDTPPGLLPRIYLDRDPGKWGGTPLQPLPGTSLGSFGDKEELHMAVCTVAH